MACRAELSAAGTHWLINGRKSWVTNGPVAERLLLFAVTDPHAGNKGITAFLIDATQPGLTRGRVEPKLGIRASATCELHFEDYACPVDCVLGQPGQGFRIAMTYWTPDESVSQPRRWASPKRPSPPASAGPGNARPLAAPSPASS